MFINYGRGQQAWGNQQLLNPSFEGIVNNFWTPLWGCDRINNFSCVTLNYLMVKVHIKTFYHYMSFFPHVCGILFPSIIIPAS